MIRAAAMQLASGSLSECAGSIELAAARRDFDQVKRDLETLRREIRSIEALTTLSAPTFQLCRPAWSRYCRSPAAARTSHRAPCPKDTYGLWS